MKSYMRHSDDVNRIFMLLEDCVPEYIMSSLLVIGTPPPRPTAYILPNWHSLNRVKLFVTSS